MHPTTGSFWFQLEIGKAKRGEGTTDSTKKLTADNLMVEIEGHDGDLITLPGRKYEAIWLFVDLLLRLREASKIVL